MYQTFYKSEIGWIEIKGSESGILSVSFVEERGIETPNLIVESCKEEIDEYFRGNRRCFTSPLSMNGTDFQKKVWNALQKVPYGTTESYYDIAVKINNPKAVRAIGNANSRNPISILVPCHRIIGKNKDLAGYAGGIWRKKWLLEHEKN